jgi:hypothetical protein
MISGPVPQEPRPGVIVHSSKLQSERVDAGPRLEGVEDDPQPRVVFVGSRLRDHSSRQREYREHGRRRKRITQSNEGDDDGVRFRNRRECRQRGAYGAAVSREKRIVCRSSDMAQFGAKRHPAMNESVRWPILSADSAQ